MGKEKPQDTTKAAAPKKKSAAPKEKHVASPPKKTTTAKHTSESKGEDAGEKASSVKPRTVSQSRKTSSKMAKLQRSNKVILPMKPLADVVRFEARSHSEDHRITSNGLKLVRLALEAHIMCMARDALKYAIHGGRVTVFEKDFKLWADISHANSIPGFETLVEAQGTSTATKAKTKAKTKGDAPPTPRKQPKKTKKATEPPKEKPSVDDADMEVDVSEQTAKTPSEPKETTEAETTTAQKTATTSEDENAVEIEHPSSPMEEGEAVAAQ